MGKKNYDKVVQGAEKSNETLCRVPERRKQQKERKKGKEKKNAK